MIVAGQFTTKHLGLDTVHVGDHVYAYVPTQAEIDSRPNPAGLSRLWTEPLNNDPNNRLIARALFLGCVDIHGMQRFFLGTAVEGGETGSDLVIQRQRI